MSEETVQVIEFGNGDISIGTGELSGNKALGLRLLDIPLGIGDEFNGKDEPIPTFFLSFCNDESIDVLIKQLNKLKRLKEKGDE